MALRRMTRSLSKTLAKPSLAPKASAEVPTTSTRSKKQTRKQTAVRSKSPDDEMLDMDLSLDPLEAALDSAADFLPSCFQSQTRPFVSLSQESDARSITFSSQLLRPSDAAVTDFAWKFAPDDDLSTPDSQLETVSGIDQILQHSSVLYSPASVAPVPSPAPESPVLTSSEKLLHFYVPENDGTPVPPLVPDEDYTAITDDVLLEDLDDIISSLQSEKPDQEVFLPNVHIGYNPPADTVELALSSQYEEGLFVFEDLSQSVDSMPVAEVAPVAGPSRSTKPVGKKMAKPAPATSSKRGRKRKASSDSDSSEERKRRQNAEAAKNYRRRKAVEMSKVFEEKEVVEKELEKVRKRLSAKMNERNILLKMLYESYRENGDSAPLKILFPPWIQTWYQKQLDD